MQQARKEIQAARSEEKATAAAIAEAIDAKTEPGFVLADADEGPETGGDAPADEDDAAEARASADGAKDAAAEHAAAAQAGADADSQDADPQATVQAASDEEPAAGEDECVSNSFMAAQNTMRTLQGMLGNRASRRQARAADDECKKSP